MNLIKWARQKGNQLDSQQYADDIKTVVEQLNSPEVILVGHSMSGSFVMEASLYLTNVKGIILVDTLKDLDQQFTYEQAKIFLLNVYRKDFASAVKKILPPYLFAPSTPFPVKQRLQKEFLEHDADLAIHAIEPLYKMDIQSIASV